MEIGESFGLRICYIDVDTALTNDWRSDRYDADIVRVTRPVPASWGPLEAAGFGVKPAWLTWLRETPATEEEFLRQLPQDVRRNFRHGVQHARSDLVDLELHAPPDAAAVDRFLTLYEQVVTNMERGVPFAVLYREQLVGEVDDTVLLLATQGGRLVGGSWWHLRTAERVLLIRFHVVTPQQRKRGLAWALYLRAIQFAREAGVPLLSLGSDPNLYGHIARTGLFCLKHRLGFRPIPSQLMVDGHDEADMILRLGTLADPTLMICYDAGRPVARLELAGSTMDVHAFRGELVVERPVAEVKMLRAGFLTDLRLRSARDRVATA